MKESLLPKKIINNINIENALSLKVKKPLQVVLRNDELWANSIMRVLPSGSITLDFGKEMCGGIRIITSFCNCEEYKVRVRFGESLAEANSDAGKDTSTNNHSPRDFCYTIPAYSDINLGETGFRFVRIDFFNTDNVYIQNIFCVNSILNKKSLYKYKGNDKVINDIFSVAKRTIDLCSSGEYIWDGVKRDRLVWIGDMHPEMLALTTLYGRIDIIEKSLDFVKNNTPLNLWMNGIASYSMWWVIIVCDYYLITGCDDYVLKQFDYIDGLIEKFDECISDDGTLKYPWNFVDWQTCESEDAESGVRAINIIALKKAREVFKHFDKNVVDIERILLKLNKKQIIVKEKKQVVALKYFATGIIDDDDYKLLTDGNAKGISTFMSYYILSAIASRDKNLAIKIMKEYYGGMLEMKATSFWEDFNIEWLKDSCNLESMPKENQKNIHRDFGDHCYKGFRHSLCHGWSSGVIRFIYETLK